MAIKLSELYKSTSRKNMKLIAGKNGINNIVSWAHMIESIETTIFLDGQELAFITGIALEK
ncbi:PucR family transcriptional regulator ligand-binding domain-containing protein, partial [Ilyobacter sp.]|uniref:PucR family transcriptional regulator ligand-binding domain-containing protein n=1 Tax=Ilyobacter sp. TaxID=3100343 RepID=UPI0035668954